MHRLLRRPIRRHPGPLAAVSALLSGVLLATIYLPAASGETAAELTLRPLSTHAEFVSGGQALIGVDLPEGVDPAQVRVTRNGEDVTAAFNAQERPGNLTGLVDDLADGPNEITAQIEGDADSTVTLEVRNHPATGPVLSGPQEQPFVCRTNAFELVDGSTLGEPLDDNCSTETRVAYAYRSTSGDIKPLPDPDARPSDLAETTTTTGATVPFLIRIETGTLNRSIYQVAMLHDPATPEPGRAQRSEGWNNRLIYTFGGGCRAGWYTQGDTTGGVLDPEMLGRGYAVVSSSLNVFGNNCNDLLAAETAVMVKEHFVERYGLPRFTIGWGCSGGSYQGHQIADNYPGVLDGIVVGCSFPDVTSATNFTLHDSRLLHHYFTETAPDSFTEEQQRAVSGFREHASIANLSDGAKRLDPDAEFPTGFPEDQRYDAETNPDGARATVYDHTVNVYGADPDTGAALRPLDNVGVQYGLSALNEGKISKEQFLDLNARIGGMDRDANPTAERTRADQAATEAAYRTGRILSGGGGLATTPIIDHRSYTDDLPNGDIHMSTHGFATRARLQAANGHADNHVMLVEDNRHGFSLASPGLRFALEQMDAWLTALTEDDSDRPDAEKVVANKPAELTDACWTRDAEPRKVEQPITPDNQGECGELYPTYPTPRLVAGAPMADDVVACELKPIDTDDYQVEFTAEERQRLGEIFPDGVCDWSKPGKWREPLDGTWQSLG